MAVQLYFGPDTSAYWATHAADYANAGINPASYEILQNTPVNIDVKVQNHGGDDAPGTSVELYYMIPTTGFPVVSATLIQAWSVLVPAATSFPVADGAWGTSISYSFPTLGHFCLRGRTFNDGLGLYPSGDPPTDPMSAIHNIQIVTTLSHKSRRMFFAFAATNPLKQAVATRLVATPIDPEKHTEALKRILEIPAVYRVAEGGTKFKLPAEVNISLGIERFIPKLGGNVIRAGAECMRAQPATFGNVGTLRSSVARALLNTRTEQTDKHVIDVDLLPLESRQTIVELVAGEGDGTLHAVEIHHETKEDKPRNLGGLVIIYRLPRTFL
jgi:hypothetical protein